VNTMRNKNWQFHSEQIKQADKLINKCNTMIRQYASKNKPHLVTKWSAKKQEAMAKRKVHQMAMWDLWHRNIT